MFRLKYFFLRGGPIVSDEGFSVDFKPRGAVTYHDEQGTILVDADQGLVHEWYLSTQRVYVGDKHGPLLKDEERKKLVLERIVAAGKYGNLSVRLD